MPAIGRDANPLAGRAIGTRRWRRLITDSDQTMMLAVGRAMDKSAALLGAAADAGDTEACFALGLLYMLGRGVDKNLGEAFKLFGLAADAGDEQAAVLHGMAAEELAREQAGKRLMKEATVAVMEDAKRRQRYPKPRIVPKPPVETCD